MVKRELRAPLEKEDQLDLKEKKVQQENKDHREIRELMEQLDIEAQMVM